MATVPRGTRHASRLVAHSQYFGKDGLRGDFGGQGDADLAQLLGGSGAIDLGAASGSPGMGEDDPLNFDPEGRAG